MGLFSVKVPEPDYAQLYSKYSTWAAEDKQQYKDTLSQTKASLAQRGVQRNSPLWSSSIASVKAQRKADKKTLEQGETFTTLNDYYQGKVGTLYFGEAQRLGYQAPNKANPAENTLYDQALAFSDTENRAGAKTFVEQNNPDFIEQNSFDNYFQSNYGKQGQTVKDLSEVGKPSAEQASLSRATRAAGGRQSRGGGGGQPVGGSWLDDDDEDK